VTTTWDAVNNGSGVYAATISAVTITQVHLELGGPGYDIMRFTVTAPAAAVGVVSDYAFELTTNIGLGSMPVTNGTPALSPPLICGWMTWPPNWGSQTDPVGLQLRPDWVVSQPSDANWTNDTSVITNILPSDPFVGGQETQVSTNGLTATLRVIYAPS
jgi:hypothetical protein